MTDRAAAFLVTLSDDLRLGDGEEFAGADRIALALGSIKGVARVEPMVSDWELHVATERAYEKLRSEIHDILWPR